MRVCYFLLFSSRFTFHFGFSSFTFLTHCNCNWNTVRTWLLLVVVVVAVADVGAVCAVGAAVRAARRVAWPLKRTQLTLSQDGSQLRAEPELVEDSAGVRALTTCSMSFRRRSNLGAGEANPTHAHKHTQLLPVEASDGASWLCLRDTCYRCGGVCGCAGERVCVCLSAGLFECLGVWVHERWHERANEQLCLVQRVVCALWRRRVCSALWLAAF